jgi:hypothetical protein
VAYHPADPLCPRETDVEASNQDDETEPAAEAVEEQEVPVAEEAPAVAAEAPAEEPAAEEAPAAEAAAEAPSAESDSEPEAAAEEAEEDEREPMDAETEAEIAAEFAGEAGEEYEAGAAAVAVATGPAVARVYICKHGHRTVSLWSTPETCLRRVKSHICGEGLVALADAPPDAKEKMLNPLKASKKAAKKS